MKMVMKHYQQCKQRRKHQVKRIIFQGVNEIGKHKKTSLKCPVCLQLLKIVGRHSLNDCIVPHNQRGCPLFMCDSIRKIQYLRTLAKFRLNIIL